MMYRYGRDGAHRGHSDTSYHSHFTHVAVPQSAPAAEPAPTIPHRPADQSGWQPTLQSLVAPPRRAYQDRLPYVPPLHVLVAGHMPRPVQPDRDLKPPG